MKNYLSQALKLEQFASEIYSDYEDASTERLRTHLHENAQKYHQDALLHALISIAIDLNRIANALELRSNNDQETVHDH